MEDLLSLADELHALAQSEIALPDDLGGPQGDRWMVRSALQKAIRRGQVSRALQLGQRLREIDPDYLWRSLAVIAVEDVGFGEADLITYSTAALSKTVRKVIGDDYGLMRGLVRRMCAAPKSRACCELSIAVDLGRPDLIESMARQSDRELVDGVQARNSGVVYVALGLIRGEFSGYSARAAVPRELVEDLITDRVGRVPSVARAAIHAFRRPVDTMSLAVLPTARLWLDQPDAVERDEVARWPLSQIIKGFAAEAMDIHTRRGGLALKALFTSLCWDYPWLSAIPAQRSARALGAVVFVEEGGLVDRRITSSALEILQETQDRALMTAYGVPEDLHADLRSLMSGEFRRLHQKREWAACLP